jgi:putative Mg2+ transporter-C (MgtC) family protein
MIATEGIWEVLGQEVTGLDVAGLTRVLVRLTVAALLGGLLGWQRQRRGKAAGLRTYMLVSLGAALFVVPFQVEGAGSADLSRVVQGVVTGVGFLGAGSILKGHTEQQIHGLTTAAGLWLTAALGVTAGLGRLSMAACGTVLAFVVLAVIGRLEQHGHQPDREI